MDSRGTQDGSSSSYDLIVLGGGPGGATLASFVAMKGHRVLLLEESSFPRHQIGESLLPATIHGICSMLGLSEEIAAAGFTRKRGGTFRWGKSQKTWDFAFTKNDSDPYGYAYQVERARFDDMLLRNAARKGVEVRERHKALELLRDGERVTGVRYRDEAGEEHVARARFVGDASGHRSRGVVGDRVYSKFFQNVALFGYFKGSKRLPPPNDGNILCAAFRDGWFWHIPLSDDVTSVGAVVSREAAEEMKHGHDEAMQRYIKACPIIDDLLAGATRISEGKYGELRVRKDYSYCNTRFWAPGVALVGDAACFIDPVFSSGVHLATYSALLAARSINTCLAGQLDEDRCFGEFELRYRREFGNFYQFLMAFYDMNQDADSYFWSARKIINTEERDNEAFIRLVAGRSQVDEPAFYEGQEFFAAREGFGSWMEQTLNPQASTGRRRRPSKTPRKVAGGFDASGFMEGFTQEIAQLQLQARLGERRGREAPLVADGLVPSSDGLSWAEAAARPRQRVGRI